MKRQRWVDPEGREAQASLIAWAHQAERLAGDPDVALWLKQCFYQSAFDARRFAAQLSRNRETKTDNGDWEWAFRPDAEAEKVMRMEEEELLKMQEEEEMIKNQAKAMRGKMRDKSKRGATGGFPAGKPGM